jgi:hypothetical protein
VEQTVKHVSISGFQVRGFSGPNIALLGAQGSQVIGSWLYDGVQYGALTAGSTNTIVADNAVISTTGILFIGICTDNFAGSQVYNNHVSGYDVGLCIQTSGAEVRNNDVTNCCGDAYTSIRERKFAVKLRSAQFRKYLHRQIACVNMNIRYYLITFNT